MLGGPDLQSHFSLCGVGNQLFPCAQNAVLLKVSGAKPLNLCPVSHRKTQTMNFLTGRKERWKLSADARSWGWHQYWGTCWCGLLDSYWLKGSNIFQVQVQFFPMYLLSDTNRLRPSLLWVWDRICGFVQEPNSSRNAHLLLSELSYLPRYRKKARMKAARNIIGRSTAKS